MYMRDKGTCSKKITGSENLLRKAKEAGLPKADENLKILHEIY